MAQQRLLGIGIDQRYGGAGADPLAYALVMEELARGYSSVADQCGLVELVATLLEQHGSRSSKNVICFRYCAASASAHLR